MHKKMISIVTPCYNEEQGIRECYETIRSLFQDKLPDYDREHIFCDNSSTDKTVDTLKEIAASDHSVKIIVNSRNFGIFRNQRNGVINASGDAVILIMPADMQDPPELIPEFVNLWEQGYEIVYGIRQERSEPFLLRTARKLYYRIISKLSYIDFPHDVGDFQLVDKKVHDAIKMYSEADPFLRMLTFETGFRSVGIPYTWKHRKYGKSRNRFWQLIDQAFIGFTSFSNVPLRLAIYLGGIISLLSFVFAFYVAVEALFFDHVAPRGTSTAIVAIFFFGGLNLIFIGLLGEYVLAILSNVRKRPIVIERERVNFE